MTDTEILQRKIWYAKKTLEKQKQKLRTDYALYCETLATLKHLIKMRKEVNETIKRAKKEDFEQVPNVEKTIKQI